MNKAVSDYMRDMQRRSAEARRAALTPEENRARMSALAKARWAKRPKKPRRVARHSNDRGERPERITPGAHEKGKL